MTTRSENHNSMQKDARAGSRDGKQLTEIVVRTKVPPVGKQKQAKDGVGSKIASNVVRNINLE